MHRFKNFIGELPTRLAYGLIGAAVVASLTYLHGKLVPSGFWSRDLVISASIQYLDVLITATVFIMLIIAFLFYSIQKLGRYKIYDGRENAMQANCSILEKYFVEKNMMLRSTRVTHWRLMEDSPARRKFRNLLTEKITTAYPVQRIWQIKDHDDLSRLRTYLNIYEKHDNYSARVILCEDVLIPEILCVGQRVASLSFPEPSTPREMGRALHFFRSKEILAISRYFDILWERAIPIKTANKIHSENLDNIEKKIESLN